MATYALISACSDRKFLDATIASEGKIGLPPEQHDVLLDWYEARFGF